jgi:hypothetical protein
LNWKKISVSFEIDFYFSLKCPNGYFKKPVQIYRGYVNFSPIFAIFPTSTSLRCALTGLFKVNLEMAIFGFDLENEISVCVRNWELKTWVLKSRF